MKSDFISRSEAKKLGATCLARRNENGQLEAIICLDEAPTVELDECVIQKVLNKRCMTAVANEYLIALQGTRARGEWNYIQAGMCVCPFCGAMPHKLYKDYCAKCGAQLKGGTEQ